MMLLFTAHTQSVLHHFMSCRLCSTFFRNISIFYCRDCSCRCVINQRLVFPTTHIIENIILFVTLFSLLFSARSTLYIVLSSLFSVLSTLHSVFCMKIYRISANPNCFFLEYHFIIVNNIHNMVQK